MYSRRVSRTREVHSDLGGPTPEHVLLRFVDHVKRRSPMSPNVLVVVHNSKKALCDTLGGDDPIIHVDRA